MGHILFNHATSHTKLTLDIGRFSLLSLTSIYIYIYINMFSFQSENRKRKPRRFSPICLPFAHRAMKVCCLSVVYEETNGSYPFANRLNGLALQCKQGILMVHLTPRRCITYVCGNSGVSIAPLKCPVAVQYPLCFHLL